MPVASLRSALADLVGEFARGAQHQCLQADLRRIQAMEQPEPEGGGLAAAGRRLRDHIAAFEQCGQALRLDRRHLHVAECIQALEQRRIERQVGEFVHAAMIRSLPGCPLPFLGQA